MVRLHPAKTAKRSVLLFSSLLFAACGGQQTSVPAIDTVVDDYGRTVVVDHEPTRIVSASPSITEIVYALGQSHRLVGRTDFCLYPPAADTLTSIGGISNLNIEAILALQPDLVVTASMIPQRSVDLLQQMGVPVVCIIEKGRYEDLYGNIRQVGRLLRCEAAADSLNRLLRQRLKSVSAGRPEADSVQASRAVGQPTTPTVYYVVGFGPTGNFTAGGNTFIDDIIRLAGGRNLAHEVEGWSYSLEALMQNDPDYIVVRREDSATFCRTHPYKQLSAVRNGRVIGIESGTLDLQVPRNIDAIHYLRNRFKK